MGFLVFAAAGLILFVAVAAMTRGITFFSVGTDNEKMVEAAARFRIFSWPSSMHEVATNRAQCREFWFLSLALTQRLLKDKKSDYPCVVLGLAAHVISTVLVYVVASHYWSAPVGALTAFLFLASFWPLEIALLIGHVHLSHLFFLLAVLATQQAALSSGSMAVEYGWDFLAGALAVVCFFSSTSSRKYMPLFLGAFLVRLQVGLDWPLSRVGVAGWVIPLAVSGVLLVGSALLGFFSKPLGRFLHQYRRHPWMVSRFRTSADADSLSSMMGLVQKARRFFNRLTLLIGAYLWVIAPWASSTHFYLSHLFLAAGAGIVFLVLMLPNLRQNLDRFLFWFHAPAWVNHFDSYPPHFFSRPGIPFQKGMRRAGRIWGWIWVSRFLRQMVPIHRILYLAAAVIGLAAVGFDPHPGVAFLRWIGLILLSLSPVILGEMSAGPQVGRSYFPALTGLVILIAETSFQIDQRLIGLPARAFFWWGMVGVVLWEAGRSGWIFLTDVWPARMAPAWLDSTLTRLGVRRFDTYETPYNDSFVRTLSPEALGRYDIRTIRTLAQSQSDLVVVPGTSSKAVDMESHRVAIERGDFDEDPLLSRLIESGRIRQYTLASFKTLGTSRFFVHETDVTSYRALILREIGPADRQRGMAWILDGKKLRRDFAQPNQPIGAGVQEPRIGETLVRGGVAS